MFGFSITSIILSRFILDLRRMSDNHLLSVTNRSSLQFAERVEDGLGGSLNSFWDNGTDGNNAEDENSQYWQYTVYYPHWYEIQESCYSALPACGYMI